MKYIKRLFREYFRKENLSDLRFLSKGEKTLLKNFSIEVRGQDKNRQYLWPLPTTELMVNPNLAQNPGY